MFYHSLQTNASQHYLTTAFLIEEGLLSIISAGCGHLVKMLISFEPHGIFGPIFTYLLSPAFSKKSGGT